jgi:alkylation response protein AidB-like acyl-CoA dehydrogenase
MRFAFSDEQLEFRDAVRQVLAKECTTDHLRAAYDEPTARSLRWSALAAMGVVGLTTPEAHGGLGLGLLDLVLLLEEAGRVGLPEDLVATTALAAPLLAELGGSGSAPLPSEPLPSAGTGSVGWWAERVATGDVAAAVGAVAADSPPVAGADGADVMVLFTPGDTDAGSGFDTGSDVDTGSGPEVHLVDASTVTVRTVSSLDPTRRLGIPHWTPTADTRLAEGAVARAAIRRTADRAAVATGAELLGLATTMITMAADYAKDRRQFGQAIGGFQAVKHLLAGAQVKLEFARPVVYAAAWALDEGEPTASRSASTAKAYASDAAVEAARVALQVHGAIGYTWECDLHLFLKRAWALSESWGSAAEHRQRVLDGLVADTRS